MKTKNPLYVIKGSTVMEARNLFDMVLKKFNLEPAYQMLMNILKMLLQQVTSYPSFVAVKNIIDQLVAKVSGVVAKFTPA